jgi:hypothetical protein
VDHARDPVRVERRFNGIDVGDVASHRDERVQRLVIEHEAEAVIVVGRVERDDRRALLDQLRDHPGSDTAVGAGHEEALLHARSLSPAPPVPAADSIPRAACSPRSSSPIAGRSPCA